MRPVRAAPQPMILYVDDRPASKAVERALSESGFEYVRMERSRDAYELPQLEVGIHLIHGAAAILQYLSERPRPRRARSTA